MLSEELEFQPSEPSNWWLPLLPPYLSPFNCWPPLLFPYPSHQDSHVWSFAPGLWNRSPGDFQVSLGTSNLTGGPPSESWRLLRCDVGWALGFPHSHKLNSEEIWGRFEEANLRGWIVKTPEGLLMVCVCVFVLLYQRNLSVFGRCFALFQERKKPSVAQHKNPQKAVLDSM